ACEYVDRECSHAPGVLVALESTGIRQREGRPHRLVREHAAVDGPDADGIEAMTVDFEQPVRVAEDVLVAQPGSVVRLEEARCLIDRQPKTREQLQEREALGVERCETLPVERL